MKLKKINCISCGGALKVEKGAKSAVCVYCGTQFLIEREEKPAAVKARQKKAVWIAVSVAIAAAVLLAVILPIALSGGGSGEGETPAYFKPAGQYLAGTDIPAGEYLLIQDPKATGARAYIGLTKEAQPGTANCVFDIPFTSRRYITVEDGQYLTVSRADIYNLEDRYKPKINGDGSYAPAAHMKAGFDIPAGLYVLTGEALSCVYDDGANVQRADARSVRCEQRMYVKAEEGQYLNLSGVKLFPIAIAPAVTADADGKFAAGQYRVGVDIPYGKYRLTWRLTEGEAGWYGVTLDNPYYDRFDGENPAQIFDGSITRISVLLDLTEDNLRSYRQDYQEAYLLFNMAVMEKAE